ncbi:MAG: phosphatase [Alphaproteobacteria bacterium]|nr:phosphatase [Alphaproteobacteria bacterium]
MKVIQGDLIQMALRGQFDAVVHGCNIFNTMGAGIALSIKKAFPDATNLDALTKKGDKSKLGNITVSNADPRCIIINAYTQCHYGSGKQVDYDAVKGCFKLVKHFSNIFLNDRGYLPKIGYPLIGCGLAGGDWKVVSKIIDNELIGCDHTLVKYSN